MVDRFELVGFGIHESRASIRLECSVATGYKWIEPGNRTVQVTDVLAAETDLEAGVRLRFAPDAPESDIQRAIGAVLALNLQDTAMCGTRWSSFDEFLVWARSVLRPRAPTPDRGDDPAERVVRHG